MAARPNDECRKLRLLLCTSVFIFASSGGFLGSQTLASQSRAATQKAVQRDAGGQRLLVIQAEDIGMAHSIDKATFKALEEGWVTTAGILVPGPWFPEVVRWARNHPAADLGARLDVNSDWSSYRWRPVSSQRIGSGLTDDGGYLSSSYVYVARHAQPEDVETELRAQLNLIKSTGLNVTHLDSHMRTLLVTPALFESYWKVSQEAGFPILVPDELIRARGVPSQKPGIYSFAGVDVELSRFPIDQEIEIMPGLAKKDWLAAYEKTLDALPPGTYVLSVHLGYDDEELEAMTWDHPNWGAQWRQNDFDVISSPEFQKFLKDKGFTVVNWKQMQEMTAEHQSP